MTYQDWLGFMQQYLQSVEKYSSIYSGQQIDTAVGKALNPDTTPTASSSALITSGAVKSAIALPAIDDTSIYASRKLPTGAETTEVLTELTGVSVGWNQLAVWIDASDKKGLTITHSNGKITVSGTPTSTGNVSVATVLITIPANHVVLLQGFPAGLSNIKLNRYIGVQMYDQGYGAIAKTTQNISSLDQIRLVLSSTTTAYNFSFYPQFVDLTVMLGSTIADYVYTLESGTAGAGVAWLKEHGFIDGAYHAYDAGSIQSVNVSSHETVGFNQWDEWWEVGNINESSGQNQSSNDRIRSKNYIPVIAGETYYFKIPNSFYLFTYDANKIFLRTYQPSPNSELLIPSGCAFIRFKVNPTYGTTYKNDICINISDSSRNGQYEPYNPHSYPLDGSLQLRGIPKLGTGNVLYYDGDTYRCDGRVVRKYGIVDLGTLSYNYDSANAVFSTTGVSGRKYGAAIVCLSNQYVDVGDKSASELSSYPSGTMASNNNNVSIKFRNTAYSDAATFKTAMSGVYLVYELASPTVEQADSFTSNQSIDPDGTESFVGGLVPPQAEARFPTGYAAKVADVLMPISGEMRPVDTVPIANSDNLITSGGVKSALDMFYIGSAYVDATANTDATIEITAPSGYTKGVFIGLYAGSSWGDITKCIVVSQGKDYPNRIKVCSTSAQRINARILWIK